MQNKKRLIQISATAILALFITSSFVAAQPLGTPPSGNVDATFNSVTVSDNTNDNLLISSDGSISNPTDNLVKFINPLVLTVANLALRINGRDAIYLTSGNLFSWGFGGEGNYFAKKVGVGISPPQSTLHIKESVSNSSDGILIDNAEGNRSLRFWVGLYSAIIQSNNNTKLLFRSGDPTPTRRYDMMIDVNGNVGIGDMEIPESKLEVLGDITTDSMIFSGRGENSGLAWYNSARDTITTKVFVPTDYDNVTIKTPGGNVDIGARNTSWAHFLTDRARFYFNKGIAVNGGQIGSYNGDLSLKTGDGTNSGGTTRIFVESDNGNVGIGNTGPSYKLDVTGAVRATTQFCLGSGTSSCISAWPTGLWTENTTDGYIYRDTGSVMIGRASPAPTGRLFVSGLDGKPTLVLSRAEGQPSIKAASNYLILDSSGNYLGLNRWSNDNVVIAYGGGNVGIGANTNPTQKLQVRADNSVVDGLLVQNVGGPVRTWLYTNVNDMDAYQAFRTQKDTENVRYWTIGTDAADDHNFKISAASVLQTNPRLTISRTTGNVGIGITDPTENLQVRGGTNYAGIALQQSSTTILWTLKADNTTRGNSFRIGRSGLPNSYDYLTISSTGNVGIGTTTPQAKLDVRGGHIEVAKDTDTVSYLGRAAIGYTPGSGPQGSDWASFGHLDRANTFAGYAIAHSSDGKTLINSSKSESISFFNGEGTGVAEFVDGNANFANKVAIQTGVRKDLSVGSYLDLYSGSASSSGVPSIRASSSNNLILNSAVTGATYINYDSGSGGVRFHGGSSVTERARLTGDGILGINTTSPRSDTKLDVNGHIIGKSIGEFVRVNSGINSIDNGNTKHVSSYCPNKTVLLSCELITYASGTDRDARFSYTWREQENHCGAEVYYFGGGTNTFSVQATCFDPDGNANATLL